MKWMMLLTRDPGAVEGVPGEAVGEEVGEGDLGAGEVVLLVLAHDDDGERDEAEDGQDDQRRDEHPLPVAVAPGRRNQLLQQ